MKKIILMILGLVVAGSIINNIRNQFFTLKEAERQNLAIKNEILRLTEENEILRQQIECATSSAFIEQEIHDKLGLGKENDVWLRLGEEKNLDLFPKINQTEEIPKIRQWVELFTR